MNSLTTNDYLNFLKTHQITHLKTIERLSNDLLSQNYNVRLRSVFEYCRKTANSPVNDNDFYDWSSQDILDWIKKTK